MPHPGLANPAGPTADAVFALTAAQLDARLAQLGAVCYTLQIYFDFSGYSDMTIGPGTMFGFSFRENFNLPYSSLSTKEFWRRCCSARCRPAGQVPPKILRFPPPLPSPASTTASS